LGCEAWGEGVGVRGLGFGVWGSRCGCGGWGLEVGAYPRGVEDENAHTVRHLVKGSGFRIDSLGVKSSD
jgi:hypothetical protein